MKKPAKLPLHAGGFLIVLGLIFDAVKFILDFLFGIGLILDPFLITPIATFIFWITLTHYGISMFSGKNWAAAWINEAVSLTPGIDAFPDWTTYAIYLTMVHGDFGSDKQIVERMQGIMK